MQHFGDGVDRDPFAFIEISKRHDDHPLRPADSQRLRPEMPQFLKVHTDRRDLPSESSNDVLILLGGVIHRNGTRFPVIQITDGLPRATRVNRRGTAICTPFSREISLFANAAVAEISHGFANQYMSRLTNLLI